MRKFKHVGGFGNETDYIYVDDDGVGFIVLTTGFTYKAELYTLEKCLSFVEKGFWEEVSEEEGD